MSDEEFDLKKKKKKSKKVDFDAFETEDAPNDGDAGVAAAVAEKIEDLDRACVSCVSLVLGFSLSSFFFVRFFLCSRDSSFHSAKRDGFFDDENAITVVEPSRFWT